MPWHSEGFNTYSLQSVCFLSALGLLIAFAYWFAVCSVTCFKHPLPYATVNWDWHGWMECQCLPVFVGWDWSGISFEERHGDESLTQEQWVIVCGVLPEWSWDARDAQATVVIESDSVYGFQNGSDRSPSPPLWIMDESNSGSIMSVWKEIVKAHFLFALLSPTKRHMRHIYSQTWNSKNRTALMFLSITVVWFLIESI